MLLQSSYRCVHKAAGSLLPAVMWGGAFPTLLYILLGFVSAFRLG